MGELINPFKPRGGAGYSDALARIKAWTRASIPPGDPVISVTELACAEPGCPPRETVILIMWDDAPAWKVRLHNAMSEVTEHDVVWALRSVETVVPAKARLK